MERLKIKKSINRNSKKEEINHANEMSIKEKSVIIKGLEMNVKDLNTVATKTKLEER